MNEITRFLGGGRTPAQSAGVTRRLKMRALRREIASADGLEREALTGELALLQAEAHTQTSERFAAHYVATKSPRATGARQEAGKARSTLVAIKSRLASLLGFSSTPAPAPTPTPPSTPKPQAGTRTAADLNARLVAMIPSDADKAVARSGDHAAIAKSVEDMVGRLCTIEQFVLGVKAVDPLGKILEEADSQNATVRERAAGILWPIFDKALEGGKAEAAALAAGSRSPAASTKPTGLAAVQASISREIGTR
ncbi:MAG: hypothetical protein JNL10_03160 [Verrucomicrobiales bacterium]|nr:hypothetical protein [Verrucomicrobiales bacterium]